MFSKMLNLHKTCIIYNIRMQQLHTHMKLNQLTKPALRGQQQKFNKITPFGVFLLIIPASAFGLGTWQVQRKKWKEGLIADLKARSNSDPVDLPNNLDAIEELEYKPVRVRGHFIHDKEMFMGPRSLLVMGDASTKSSLISNKTNTAHGYLVVTPFKLADRDETILVNRGWVPSKHRDPKTRQGGQVEGDINLIGVVRLQEARPTFSMKNQEGSNIWFYRDLNQMANIAGTAPIFLDATDDFPVKEGPIGGQTRISLRNEHMSYILTWYSLFAATSLMWYKKFIH
ncbi:SURF1-like protein [Aethina tumida]|uniref:SURF1-like protein n=1 Tax=Aethina tumida TaxID=116153 RepID=UPI0021481FA2|nr:SURF1-like protein [Aethina tumida]